MQRKKLMAREHNGDVVVYMPESLAQVRIAADGPKRTFYWGFTTGSAG